MNKDYSYKVLLMKTIATIALMAAATSALTDAELEALAVASMACDDDPTTEWDFDTDTCRSATWRADECAADGGVWMSLREDWYVEECYMGTPRQECILKGRYNLWSERDQICKSWIEQCESFGNEWIWEDAA